MGASGSVGFHYASSPSSSCTSTRARISSRSSPLTFTAICRRGCAGSTVEGQGYVGVAEQVKGLRSQNGGPYALASNAHAWLAALPSPPAVVAEIQDAALAAFRSCGTEVYGRVDVMLRDSDQAPFVLEINTIPGFTAISMYPKMWEASGLPYRELLTRLIELALRRGGEQRQLVRDYAAG